MKRQESSDFSICIRKRPAFTGPDVVSTTSTTISVTNEKVDITLKKYYETKTFDFDHVFSEDDNTFLIYYSNIKKYIDKKQNFICYTFGETGSGKTYTLFGENGLVELALYKLLDTYDKVIVTSFEIYKNQIYDLINKREKVMMMECEKEINIPALKKYECADRQVYDLLRLISRNRIIGESSQNETSSRSHVVINIKVDNTNYVFVDLAGSEKGSKSIYTNKHDHYEMAGINKDIFALKECMRYMKSNSERIPFRSSKLTMALKESFYDHYNALMIVAISPEKSNVFETLNILTCANDFKTVKRKIKIEKEISKDDIKFPNIVSKIDTLHSTATMLPKIVHSNTIKHQSTIPYCNPPNIDPYKIYGAEKYNKLKRLLVRETTVCKDYLTLTIDERRKYSHEFGNKMAEITKNKINIMNKIDNSFYKKI